MKKRQLTAVCTAALMLTSSTGSLSLSPLSYVRLLNVSAEESEPITLPEILIDNELINEEDTSSDEKGTFNFTCSLVGNEACLSTFDSLSEDAVLPSSYEYMGTVYSVTYILKNCFNGNTTIKSVDIPNSVKNIAEESFADCTILKATPHSCKHLKKVVK